MATLNNKDLFDFKTDRNSNVHQPNSRKNEQKSSRKLGGLRRKTKTRRDRKRGKHERTETTGRAAKK